MGFKIRRWAVAAATLATSLTLLPAPSANATTTCGTRGNYFDGFYFNPVGTGHTMRGLQADLTVQASGLCNNGVTGDPNNFSNAWTMWQGGNGANEYVQSGYEKNAAAGFTQGFSQYNRASAPGPTTKYVGSQYVAGTTVTFQQLYSFSGSGCTGVAHCALSYRGNILMQATDFDPVTTWSSPFYAEYEGEASYTGNDIPGSAAVPAAFANMYYVDGNQSNISQPCVGTNGGSTISTTRWTFDRPACNQMRIWTK